MPSKARDRHLAKNAERRRQQRERSRRGRRAALGVGGAVTGVLLVILGIGLLTRDDVTDAGAGTPTPTSSGSASAEPTQVGTVTPVASPADTVACGGKVPTAASEPKPQFDRAPTSKEVLQKDTTYTAVLETSCGSIEVELDATTAPETVASFVFLAQQGYFDGTFVHRVVDSIDVVQGGDPLGDGTGGPGYSIPDELTGKEHYATGSVAMANGGAGTGGSQFFLITGPEGANLDSNPNYTIFGQIVAGLDVAKKINALMATTDGTYDGPPTKAVYIDSVKIKRAATPTKPASPAPSPSA